MQDGAGERFGVARVARLATVTPSGHPHLVPVVFALRGRTVWTAVDTKRKSTRSLRRLANVEANPAVSLLVDHYAADWSTLWWVRADGTATVVSAGSAVGAEGLAALAEKYRQYRTDPPPGPVLVIAVHHWSSWSAR